jgi:hypothetical protein
MGADSATCEDVLVYADAREERRSLRPPLILDGVRLLTLIDPDGRPISGSVLLSTDGSIIDGIAGEIGGYTLEILGRCKVRRRFRGRTAPAESAVVWLDKGNMINFDGLTFDAADMEALLRAVRRKEVPLQRVNGLTTRVISGPYRGLVIEFEVDEGVRRAVLITCPEGRSFRVPARS